MQGLIALLSLPLMLLNFFGVIVGIVWLMVLGEWRPLGVALFAIFAGVVACSFALMPGLLVTAPALMMHEKGGAARIASYPLMFLGLAWTFAVMCAWALWWFAYYFHIANLSSLVPMMLVAYGVATSPWSYMAQKEAQGGNDQSAFTLFFLQIACAVIFVMSALVRVPPLTSGIVFLSIMAFALLLNVVMACIFATAERAARRGLE